MKKRGFRKFALGILGGLVLSLNVNAATIGIVNVENLNVRSGPSTTSSIVDSVHFGDKLEILSQTDQWYKIDLDILSNAYVHSSYINIDDISKARIVVNNGELRNSPNLLGNKIADIANGEFINIVYQTGEWYYVSTSEGNGYMHSNSFVVPDKDVKPAETEDSKVEDSKTEDSKTESSEAKDSETKDSEPAPESPVTETPKQENKKVVTVTTNVLNVRQEASIDSNKIGQVYRYNTFDIISELEEWVSIQLSNGNIGYIYKTYVEISDQKTIANVSQLRQEVVNYAQQFLGNPYVWGGNSLTKGVDCSGFTQQVMKKFGVSINRTASTQYRNGTRISQKDLLPGDLVFFGYNGRISHVGLYIGNGKVIHANNPRTGIVINTLTSNQMLPYIGATRVLN